MTVNLSVLQVRLPHSSSPGAEGPAQAGGERGHLRPRHRLDREETLPGVPGKLQHQIGKSDEIQIYPEVAD